MDTIGKARLLFFLFCRMAPCFATEITVRLAGGNGKESESAEGIVEFFFNGTWGGICYNDFRKEDGGVVCRHLNFSGIEEFDLNFKHSYKHHHNIEVSCYGHEENLHKCIASEVDLNVGYNCKNSTLHITCRNESVFVKADLRKVRLVGGNGSYGIVEFFSMGSLRTIYGADWTLLEGGVVCRELGFRGVNAVTLRPNSTITTRAGFKCNGSEFSLQQCQKSFDVLDGFDSYESVSYGDKSVEITCLCDIHFALSPSNHIHETTVGENLTLTCEATNSKEVLWEHLSLLKEKENQTLPVLHLQNISLADQGIYFCVAIGDRGQVVKSQAAKIVIPDYWQVLLDVETNSSSETPSENINEIHIIVERQFQESGYEVSIKGGADVNFTVHLSKLLSTKNNYDSIPNDTNFIFEKVRDEVMKRLNIQISKTSIQALSFCMKDTEESDVGKLSFTDSKIYSNATSEELCISSNVSRASRECSGDLLTPPVWKAVVFRNCFENLTDNIDEVVEELFKKEYNITPENAAFIAHELADITAAAKITEKSINKVANILEKIVNANSSSEKVTGKVIETIDNIVNQSAQHDAKLNSKASSIILKSLEKQLETAMRNGSYTSVKGPNIVVESVQIEDLNSPVNFAYFHDDSGSEIRVNQNISYVEQDIVDIQLQIPTSILNKLDCKISNSSQDSTPITFTIYLNDALFQDSQPNKRPNSLVVSVLMLCTVFNLPPESSVSILFSPTSEMDTEQREWECVFWNHSLPGDSGGRGGWSSKGWMNWEDKSKLPPENSNSRTNKKRVNGSVGFYNCSWNHLTNFAVLLDMKGDSINKALDVLSIVGCAVSIVCLLVTIASHLCVKRLRKSGSDQVTMMLCSALLGLYCNFLIGIHWTEPRIVCIIFGGLIHFFCLSSVAWMSVEATQLYLLLVRVFNAHVRYFVLKASVIAWGFPAVVVAVCTCVARDDYAHGEYCFPRNYAFFIGVFGLVALLLMYNIVMYGIIVWNISVTRENTTGSQTDASEILRGLQNACMISFLLGVSWLFGFLAVGGARLAFNILFCLFNSFQGLFIFLLFCLRRNEIREAWRDWFGIALCLETGDGAGTVSGKPGTSQTQPLRNEGATVSTSVSKTTKSEQLELVDC